MLHRDFMDGYVLGGTNEGEGKLKHGYYTNASAQIHKNLLFALWANGKAPVACLKSKNLALCKAGIAARNCKEKVSFVKS